MRNIFLRASNDPSPKHINVRAPSPLVGTKWFTRRSSARCRAIQASHLDQRQLGLRFGSTIGTEQSIPFVLNALTNRRGARRWGPSVVRQERINFFVMEIIHSFAHTTLSMFVWLCIFVDTNRCNWRDQKVDRIGSGMVLGYCQWTGGLVTIEWELEKTTLFTLESYYWSGKYYIILTTAVFFLECSRCYLFLIFVPNFLFL